MLTVSDHPRERGIGPDDLTSYLPSQKEWGPDRDIHWPKIEGNVLHRFERKGYPIPDYKPELWYDEGRIVLDLDDNPILKFKVIPTTLSSELSGRDMEAMKRLDLRISLKDFRARMPSTIMVGGKNKSKVRRSLYTLSTLGMRTTRFRQENGLISWTNKQGSASIRSYMLEHMSQTNIDANSTQGMRLQSRFQQQDSRSSNKGKTPSRAGSRALPDAIRKERAAKEEEKMEKLRADDTNVELTVRSGVKRKHNEDSSQAGGNLHQHKRAKTAVAQSASQATTDFNLPSQSAKCPDAPSCLDSRLNHPVPPVRGYKRSHEELSSDDDENVGRSTKRHKAYNQPVVDMINRHKAPLRSVHRRPEYSTGGMAFGSRLSPSINPTSRASQTSHMNQTEQRQILSHPVSENRHDGSMGFNIGESNPSEAQGQQLQSVESRLGALLEGWLAQN